MKPIYSCALIAACLAILSSGCAVLDSQHINNNYVQGAKSTGGYFLPKSLVRMRIERDGTRVYIARNEKCLQTGDDSDCKSDPFRIIKVPDPGAFYSLDYHASGLSSDNVKIEYTKEGFLKSITASVEDKSPEIVQKLAELYITIQTGVPITKVQAQPDILLDGIFDLTDPDQRAEINKLLEGERANVYIALRLVSEGDLPLRKDIYKGNPEYIADKAANEVGLVTVKEAKGRNCSTGVCYRPALPYFLELRSKVAEPEEAKEAVEGRGLAKGKILSAYVVLLENRSPILEVDVSRSAFIKRDTTLTFTDGMLTTAHIIKPSEALAFVGIPLNIVNALFEAPAKMLKFNYDYTNKEQQLVEAQKKLFDSQQALLKAKDDARKAEEAAKKAKEDANAAADAAARKQNSSDTPPKPPEGG